MGQLGLHVITGPANAGKVALLLRRYLEALDSEPYLIVPNRSDVERVERDLLALQPALLAGSIGTFDDLFRRIARRGSDTRPDRKSTRLNSSHVEISYAVFCLKKKKKKKKQTQKKEEQ